MTRVLYEDAHVTLSVDDAAGLVRYVRSSERFVSIDDVRAVHQRIADLAIMIPRNGLKLLLDVREAPARNDEAFEQEITRALQAFTPRFGAHAMLVRSAVGRLQTHRLARERGEVSPPIFGDEAEALQYLGVGPLG